MRCESVRSFLLGREGSSTAMLFLLQTVLVLTELPEAARQTYRNGHHHSL